MASAKGIRSRAIRELATFVGDRSTDLLIGFQQAVTELPPLGNPIATGHSRSNWLSGVNQVPSGVVGSRQDPAHSAGEDSLRVAVTLSRAAARLGRIGSLPVLHCANNVDYITKLNNGSSAQTPAGFVQRAVDRTLAANR